MSFFKSTECERLKQITGFTDKDITDSFSISDDGVNWILKTKWMEQTLYKKMMEYNDAVKGRYIYNEREKFSTFIIPKSEVSVTPFVVSMDKSKPPQLTESKTPMFSMLPITALVEPAFKLRFKPDFELGDLIQDVKVHGIDAPITVRPRKDGLYEIVYGDRRFKAAKQAGLTEVPVIVRSLSDKEALAMQLRENVQRKDLDDEEKKAGLANYAKVTGLHARQISLDLNMSYSWVCKYLPEEFKAEQQREAGKLGGAAISEAYRESQDVALQRRAESQETIQPKTFYSIQEGIMAELVMCEGCGSQVHRSRLELKGGKLLCPKCRGEKPQPERESQVKVKMYKETGEYREAVMHPQVSAMELAVLEELKRRGHKVEFQVRVALVETVIDYMVDNVPFYLDGKYVHLNRDWKDDVIREKLSQKLGGKTVYAIEYERMKKDSAKQIVDSMETNL